MATIVSSFGNFLVLDALGNTTTQLGKQEWLINAATGDKATPMGVREGVERVCALAENWI